MPPGATKSMKQGLYVTKCQAVTVVLAFTYIVIAVGLMAGLIRPPCPEAFPSLSGSDGADDLQDSDLDELAQGHSIREDGNNPAPWADEPWTAPFLPDYTTPLNYDLWFYPDFYNDGSTFYGRVTIQVSVSQDTIYLLVNIKDMNVTLTQVTDSLGGELSQVQTFFYEPNEMFVVEFVSPIPAGSTVDLYMEFTGSLTNGIVGYYKSTYVNSITGKESWLATTKFQPSDSRKAFPNFDEPRFKTPFTVTLRHWNNFTALSNQPVLSFLDEDVTWRQTTFETTDPQSSYLVCFIVCDFSNAENTLQGGQPNKVWASPDKMNQVNYPLQISKTINDWMSNEFDYPYMLPKQDHFAVPDYPSGATEHWGLFTYRQGRLLYDPTQVGDIDRQSIAKIVAHELAHNYFGDLVTCYWWNDLWLNEGFASYYEDVAAEIGEPGLNTMGQFVVKVQQPVMDDDSLNSSRPLLIEINTPDEANAAFDGITYDKGSSIVRMMEGFLGHDTFIAGIRAYLAGNQFQSVVTQDLLDYLQGAVGPSLNMTAVMNPWMYQMGLPIVDVERNGQNLHATQRRFMRDPTSPLDEPSSPYNYLWYIPLTFKTETGDTGMYWMNMGDVDFPAPEENGDWIKFNVQQTGYYRVKYAPDLFSHITDQIFADYTAFTPVDRSGLLDDALMIPKAGQASYAPVLNLTLYMTAEVDYEPWKTVRSGLEFISLMLHQSGDFGLYRSYIQYLTGPRMDTLKVQDSGTHMEKLNRDDIIRLACGHGHFECLQNTTRLFLFWIQNDTVYAVPQNLRRQVYGFGMATAGNDAEFDVMWDRYTTATSTQEQENILWGMSQTDKMWLIQKLLDYSMDPTKIRSQDFFTLVGNIAANRAANSYLWDWVRATYQQIVDRFGLDNRSLGTMVPNIVDGYNTKFKLQEVEDFFAEFPDPGTGARAREEALASIQNNIMWMTRSQDEVVDWLQIFV